ncbi:Rv1355c family protein [Algoriphagus sanaruensis]|uniref:THIF-type NAD/FAD binding fold domain-containing protein n=1 Tax=Algoriphagus sanaruensis TaxID=1727163 RepID=A0A142EMN0_9BACT|nr:Rv1355c family protein [Algoriphagus sanaruensis]AMQ56385.1 hypothetical protein AO498_08160 [Algoriphagus sanaruensis]
MLANSVGKRDLSVFPELLNPEDSEDWKRICDLRSNSTVFISDEIFSQVSDLIKANHPESQLTKDQLGLRVEEFFAEIESDKYGNWFYYPWKNVLVHLLPEEDFIKVRTIRNNYKITPLEQELLAKKKVGIVGLSVGQSVALAMALERSCGEMRLADFDTLELSNLNRIKAGVTSLGVEKLVIAAREISEIDPYLKLTLFREGVHEWNVEDFLTRDGVLDLLVDECDSFDIKILLREKAKNHRIPVMMDTSDRGMLDIERYDIEPDRKIFHGFLGEVDPESLKSLSNTQKVAFGLKITGLETLSPRMKASLLEVGQSITSWPQLASGVFLGGASVSHVARKLLIGEKVKSGRYYVDLDELIPVETETFEIPAQITTQSDYHLPTNILPSGYLPDRNELLELVEHANYAPSGGNVQPWIWIYDKRGVLHLIHDRVRSHSLLDYKGTGSLIAFGAALENLRLICAQKGIETEEILHANSFEDDLIASIRFVSKSKEPRQKEKDFELVNGIKIRCTNRKNPSRKLLDIHQMESIKAFCQNPDFILEEIQEMDQLENLAKVIGGMDRMRLFHQQGLKDFIHEIRWNDQEAFETKDGIDVATLELNGTEKAAMGLLKDPRTVSFFRKFFMGYGLTKISKATITSSSAMFLLSGKDFSPKSYLQAGKILQKIWLWTNLNGISFQPVTASLFIFHRVLKENDHGFTEAEKKEIVELKESFNLIFNKGGKMEELFMFRVNFAGEPTVRSFRRDVAQTLKFLD